MKIILAHRVTGMVERLIQTLKRRLAAVNMDKKWSKEILANKISAIIENIKLIPNTTTKISPSEAHSGRKPNTNKQHSNKTKQHKIIIH